MIRRATVASAVCAALLGLALPAAAADTTAAIEQIGSYNAATIVQGAATGSSAEITQKGDGNVTTVIQGDGANLAMVHIEGSGNGTLDGGVVEQQGPDNVAGVIVVGDGNAFGIVQSGIYGGGIAGIAQVGSGNSATISQTNDFSPAVTNAAGQAQTGHDNIAIATQIAASGALLFGGNAIVQDQWGDGNEAIATQNGSDNLAVQTQIGNGNKSEVEQNGSFNVFIHTQIGNGIALPKVTQSGGAVTIMTQTN